MRLADRPTINTDISTMRRNENFRDELHKLYVELLQQKIEQHNTEPRHMHDMDEKHFLVHILSKMRCIFTRRRHELGETKSRLQNGSHK